MVRRIWVVVFLLSVMAGVSWAKDATVEFEGRYWITNMDGKTKVTQDDQGSVVDFKDDLGMSNKDFPEGRFTWYINPRNKIRLAYMDLKYSGDTTLQRNILFKGKTYSTGAPVSSDLDLQYLRLGWAWQPINLAQGKFKVGPLFEVKTIWAKTSLSAPTLGLDETEKIWAPLPTVGAIMDWSPHKMVNVFAEISGIFAGKYGYLYDGEIGVKFMPVEYLSVIGGYRGFSIKAESDPDYIKMDVRGPFLGATLRF